MRELVLIGIGTGNPDHVTHEAQKAIRDADLILVPDKGEAKSDLAELRRRIIAAACPDHAPPTRDFQMPRRDPALPYAEAVEAWHDEIARRWSAALAEAPGAGRVALLVWGDPSLYDSTLRIAARLEPAPKLRVIPGITSLQALTAAHAIPLNTLGGAVTITTGRALRESGWPEGAESVAVMLDAGGAFEALDRARYDIWWGAYVGMDEELLIAGPLAKVAGEILDRRARARAAHGWIMDIYLLRRRPG